MTSARRVVIGVDTHLETIHVAALTDTGQPLGDAEFGTTPSGYYVALRWAQSFGEVFIAGVEGTSSYGAGFTQTLQDNEIHVVEVKRYSVIEMACRGHWRTASRTRSSFSGVTSSCSTVSMSSSPS